MKYRIYRVLQPGGKVFVGVPFLHLIHGDSSDYTRFTEYRIRREFDAFSSAEVRAHDEGQISAVYSIILSLLNFNFLKYLAWRSANLLDEQVHRVTDLFAGNYPLYYLVRATK